MMTMFSLDYIYVDEYGIELPFEEQNRRAIESLIRFIEDSKDFLTQLVNHGRAFVPELLDSIRSVWNSRGSERFDNLVKKLREFRNNVEDWEERLDEHGLTGQELYMKLKIVAHFFGDLISGGGIDTLKKLIEAIDNLLDSIIELLGLSGAAKEIKESIKILVLDD